VQAALASGSSSRAPERVPVAVEDAADGLPLDRDVRPVERGELLGPDPAASGPPSRDLASTTSRIYRRHRYNTSRSSFSTVVSSSRVRAVESATEFAAGERPVRAPRIESRLSIDRSRERLGSRSRYE
jgi:hypothetical protein